jgi:hypothetical protein
MTNRKLMKPELADARLLLTMVRAGLHQLANGDQELLFALRRKVYKELVYDERNKPSVRSRLKRQKRSEQNGLCVICMKTLPEKYCVLDRFDAALGYTGENSRLICPECDTLTQKSRGYA